VKDFIFIRDQFFRNALSLVPFGAWLGYNARVSADSGINYYPNLYLQAALLCGASVFIATAASHLIQKWLRVIPSFLFIAFLGPLFFGLGYRSSVFFENPRRTLSEFDLPASIGLAGYIIRPVCSLFDRISVNRLFSASSL
jgi:hypothetical protein